MSNFDLRIIYSNPDAIYYSGQVLAGTVVLGLHSGPLKLRSIKLKLKGQAKVEFEETESFRNSEGRDEERTITRHAKQEYFKNDILLLSSSSSSDPIVLPIGEYNYPFSFILQNNLPSSFQTSYGSITYSAKVKIDVPWAIDKHTKSNFIIRSLINLNDYPDLKKAIKKEKSKTFCCLCCKSGPLTMVAYIPKSGFTPDAPIPVTVEVDNASDIVISSLRIYVKQQIVCKANGGYTKSKEDELCKLDIGRIEASSTKTFSESLSVPNKHYPNLSNCSIIDIDFYLEVKAVAEGPHNDLNVKIPIRLGDVPLSEGVNIMQYQPPQQIQMTYPSPQLPTPYSPQQAPISYPSPQAPAAYPPSQVSGVYTPQQIPVQYVTPQVTSTYPPSNNYATVDTSPSAPLLD